jgi:steroid Delta-isomerase
MPADLLGEYVDAFNEGVRTGAWDRMLAFCADDVELEFVGIPVGPFRGRAEVADAYRAQPPDDELVLLERTTPTAAVYAWAREPERPAGELDLETTDNRVSRIRVYYETSA